MKQSKLRYSEAFYSIQGEGRFVGVPSVFLRTFGCNFECAGFGQERGNYLATDQMPYMLDPKGDKNHLNISSAYYLMGSLMRRKTYI